MKHILSLSAVATLAVMFSVSQTGCTEGYVVTSDPGPAYSPYVPYGVATTAAQDSITAPTMGIPATTEIGMGALPIGMTVQGAPTVREAAPPTGMMGPEAQPVGAAARLRGIMARVTSADIGEARRAGAADRARGTAPVVARVRGGVEPDTCLGARKRDLPRTHSPPFGLWQIAVTNGCLARGFLIEPSNEA